TALISLVAATSLIAAACGSDDDTATTEPAPVETDAAEPDAASTDTPPLTPAAVTAEAQDSDGSSVTVASVTLPAPGFVAVHADNGGAPGAVIGNSELLPAGESTDVVISFDESLADSQTVFPMAHVDVNDNGVYEFNGSDVTTDQPATTEAGDVAVVPVELTIG
ncbi:MAG: hypothetical protein WA964_01135, partial [Ilumatobacter sp.]|uniref:DUF7282 domain-containing protein n=1 Tax=Ilumatobacter sp. TaxID=1967498 RepID=UPI003C72EDCE